MEPLRTRPWSRGARVRYFPEFKKATLDMIVSRGGVVGWTADAAAVRGALLGASHGLLDLSSSLFTSSPSCDGAPASEHPRALRPRRRGANVIVYIMNAALRRAPLGCRHRLAR